MNPAPTITISLDYLVELSDDGMQPNQPGPEVIIIPPASHGTSSSPAPESAPEENPQP
jgi:hypothetical protein